MKLVEYVLATVSGSQSLFSNHGEGQMKKKFISVISIVFLAVFTLAACATGSSIVVGDVREPLTPDQVQLYLQAPTNYEVIGIVDASSDAGWTEQGAVDYAVEELKKQAARLGANGVLLEQQFGDSVS